MSVEMLSAVPRLCRTFYLKRLPLPSNRRYRSNGDCLEVRGKLLGLFCAVLCATIVHSAMHTATHTRTALTVICWLGLAFLLCFCETVWGAGGHSKCLASLVGPVHVLSTAMFLCNCLWTNKDGDDDDIVRCSLAFRDYFVIVYLCMCAFVVLDLVSSVL